ncbi:unnamed protein product [Aspergillus oryzae RIB40]|uniref:DNA, SC103 n=1 Tax=Aspergillus oryzae (strain ATCC 42149 / RIB 40) TaxID=510516 RepID=Q2TYZ4_ASPOR|nr:unnamed protein product [Aspergillus oryzae RIB40]BAE65529.1 unnamed protein product [Aspergillus oryzae RIB40]
MEEDEETQEKQEEYIEETTTEVKGSQVEIMESAQASFEEGPISAGDDQQGAAEADEGFVPESENEDAEHEEDEDEDEGPVTRRRTRPNRSQQIEEPEQPDEEEPSGPRRSSRKKPKSSQRKRLNDEESDFEPEEEDSNDDDEVSQTGKSNASPRKASQARDDEEDSAAGRRPGLRKRASRSRGQSEAAADIAEELAEELEDLRGGRPRRRLQTDIVDDEGLHHPRGSVAGVGSALGPHGAGLLPGQTQTHDAAQGLSGTPANLGKVKDKQALADADPLGVDMSVNFDSVGGLQGHIDQLKEMVSLPLLYPEIFQRFHIVPPRGVLFHGPPGTGKTLLARALANSVSSEGRKVTFYMRKGADALSKWVGEAERQLRLLFEEARKTQPSIIFFDEIDGLAPVRSSKQEQIHASIVSTLLALMDGMDGRGQVIVIGATNRPDSIDPALRRPGRFDREFYFPLPNAEGRRAILDIHTKGWDPPLPGHIKDELAEITKGYGGADLRALCTEAALNAVQRRYPQIYKSDKKLLIDPKNIDVTPKDFMLAIKKMVPSSERSTSSGASPLPKEVEPLLRHPLADIRALLSEILPQRKRLTALEEAQFEEPEGAGSFQREQMQQEFDRSRVFRPRMLLRGLMGMGQQYLAAAILHYFEGLHVQSFDLPTLLSDSTRSPEAAVIQLFAEVKRHRPSVIYIPNIESWSETVGQAVLSTFLGLLRSIPPTDPVLLLGVQEITGEEIDTGLLRQMFGFSKRNFYDLKAPGNEARYEYFSKVVEYIKTSPAHFPDPENRKKRELETLEIAPPPPPKPTTPLTKEQLKAQKKKDHQTLNLLKIRIQPIMDQIKKYKRFRTGVIDESQIRYLWEEDDPNIVTSDLPIEQRTTFRPFEKAYDKHGVPGLWETVSGKFFYNMEIVTIEKRLSNGYYKRPSDFLADIKRLAKDARQTGDQERILRANELLSNVEVDISTIEQAEPQLVAECENVYIRELAREKAAAEKAKRVEEAEKGGFLGHTANHNVPHGNTESGPSSGPVVLGETFPDLAPKEQARPVTPTRQSTASFLTNGYHQSGGSDLNDLSARGPTSNEHLPDTQQCDSSQPSPRPRESLPGNADSQPEHHVNGSQSQPKTQPPVPLFDESTKPSSHPPVNLHSILNDEDHSPKLIVDSEYVQNLHEQLTQRTSGCSVEQLEQINTSLMDYLWRTRGEWNRSKVAAGIRDSFNEILEDMQAMQEIGPISQRTKEQLGSSFEHL